MIPLLMDDAGTVLGVFALYTTEGSIVVFFSGQQDSEGFADVMAPVVQRGGQRLGFATMDGNSIGEVLAPLIQADPTLLEATFLPSNSPIVAELMNQYRDQYQ